MCDVGCVRRKAAGGEGAAGCDDKNKNLMIECGEKILRKREGRKGRREEGREGRKKARRKPSHLLTTQPF